MKLNYKSEASVNNVCEIFKDYNYYTYVYFK